MIRIVCAFGLFAMTSIPGLAHAANYYVSINGADSAAGTQTAPWRTIAKGLLMVRPGDTLNVGPGSYGETVTANVDGTATARIRYVSTTKWGAKLKEFVLNRTDYTDLVGFDLDWGNNTTPTNAGSCRGGIYDDGGQHNKILNNRITSSQCSGIDTTGSTAAGSYIGVDTEVTGNVIHHTGTSTLTHGIYFAHPVGTIKNNIIYDVPGGYGIHLWHNPKDIVISSNLVFGGTVGSGAIVVGAGDFTGAKVDNVLVANNIFRNNRICQYENGSTGTNIRWRNNVCFANTSNTDRIQTGNSSGKLTSDPRHVNFQLNGTGDYHLAADSPAIDSGISEGAPTTDIAGATRPQGAGFDRGPYEFAGTVNPPPPPPPPPPADITAGLQGYWKLDETGTALPLDSSGMGNAATVVGTPGRVAGKIGGAFRFDGGSQRITFANTNALNLSSAAKPSWTIAAWVRPIVVTGTVYPVVYTYGNWMASLGLSDAETGTDGRVEHWRNVASFLATPSALPLNTWTHVVVTRTSTSTIIYVNGVNVRTGSSTTINAATSGTTYACASTACNAIGGTPKIISGEDAGLNGDVDEVRVYNRALTAADVTALYNYR